VTEPPPIIDDDDYVDSEDEDAFAAAAAQEHKETMWIIKPAAMNRGRGIKVVKNIAPLRAELRGDADDCFDGDAHAMGIDAWRGAKMDVLVQRYLTHPLLVHGKRKFDVRAYCLVSRCDDGNLIAYFHEGYARVGLVDYDPSDAKIGDDLVHLTNIAVQRRHPDYEKLKDQAVMSMANLQTALASAGIPEGWVLGEFTDQMKASMAAVIAAAAPKFDRRAGCFDLLGFDFMATAGTGGFQAHLIEVNTNPALHVSDGQRLEEILPKIVRGTLDIVLEEHGVEAALAEFVADRKGFGLIFEEKKAFRFLGVKEWVRRFSDASDASVDEERDADGQAE
jgi:hypothetical protein